MASYRGNLRRALDLDRQRRLNARCQAQQGDGEVEARPCAGRIQIGLSLVIGFAAGDVIGVLLLAEVEEDLFVHCSVTFLGSCRAVVRRWLTVITG